MPESDLDPLPEHPAGPLFAFAEARAVPPPAEPGRPGPESARPAWNERTLGEELSRRVGVPIGVKFGRARTYPVQATREPDGTRHLRLHAFFREAPDSAIADLSAWLRSGKRARAACERLDAYLDESLEQLGRRRPPRRLATRGEHLDLLRLHGELLADPTAAPVHGLDPCPAISFGRFSSRKPRRRLLLGSYDPERHWVKLHPLLDHARIPASFARFLLFHELLHAALPRELDRAGRVRHHGPRFKEAEAAYSGTAAAVEWERRNQALLFRLARR